MLFYTIAQDAILLKRLLFFCVLNSHIMIWLIALARIKPNEMRNTCKQAVRFLQYAQKT